MSDEYRKYIVTSESGDVTNFVVYSSTASYENRRSEVLSWIEKLASSAKMKPYEVEVKGASWTEATISDDSLFEKHYPG